MNMRSFSNRPVLLAFGAPIAILLLVGALCYRSIVVSDESERSVQHTHEVLGNLQSLTGSMEVISSSTRRFVITGEESDLEPYHAARLELERLGPALRKLTSDNPEQQRRLSVLEKLAADRVTRVESVMSLRREQGIEAAMEVVREGPSARVTAELKAVVGELQGEEERLLLLRDAAAAENVLHTKVILLAGIVLGLLITCAAGWSVLRDDFLRARAERALYESERKYRTSSRA